MNFSSAFGYITEDARWKQKFGIAALLNMSVFFWGMRTVWQGYSQASWLYAILGIVITLAPGMMTLGYGVNISRNVRENVRPLLPEWSFFEHWKQGATLSLASAAYVIPIMLAVWFALTQGLIGRSGFLPIALLFMSLSLLIRFLMATLQVNFTRTDSLGSCFHWKGVGFIMKNRWRELLMLMVFSTVIGMVAARGFTMGGNFWVGALIASVMGALGTFMDGHLYGQIASMIDIDKMNSADH